MSNEAVHRPCPVCGGVHCARHWRKGELRIVRCTACGMVFVNPAPRGMTTGEFYDTEGAEYYLSPAKLQSDYAEVRFERELKLFREFAPGGAVLDVGCGSGAFLFQLQKRWPDAYEIVGTDVSGAPLDYAESRGVPVARGNFLEMDSAPASHDTTLNSPHPSPPHEPRRSGVSAERRTLFVDEGPALCRDAATVQGFKVRNPIGANSLPVRRGEGGRRPGAGFDAITLWAVAEHLAEPKKFLEKAHSLLKPQGLCFVLVPNLHSLAVRLLGAKYRYVYAQHLNYFSARTLARLGKDAGFAVASVRFMHFNPVVIWQDWRRHGREVSNAERGALLQRTTALKQKSWLKPVKCGYALAEKLLAASGLADNLVLVLRRK